MTTLAPWVSTHACTVCDSATAHQVRAGIWDGHFGETLLFTALPFPLLALSAWLVVRSVPNSSGHAFAEAK